MELVSMEGDGRGQSAIIGVVILLALAMFVATAVVALGGTALSNLNQRVELGQAEHSMTQFDSLVAQVALGDSRVQSLQFTQPSGSYHVEPSAGSVQIIHVNHSGGDNSETIYQADFGTVVYENGDRTIAYQGGGVWRKGPVGEARMISPPEFHYRGATLTFPVVRVNQDGTTASASGSPTATIEQVGSPAAVYPNASRVYSGTSKKYLNPADNGTVYADVRSEYYRAWANYFRSRTEGDVETFPGNETVRVHLISTGDIGDFQMPSDGGSIDVRGVSDHSMTDFSIEIVDDQNDSADMDNLKWTLWVEDGDRQFEMHLRKSGGSKCPDTITVKAVIYYSPADGDADDSDPYHGWKDDDAYSTSCRDVDGDGEDETVLEVDFVDDEDGDNNVSEVEPSDEMLTYQALGSDDTIHFGNPGNNLLLEATTTPAMEEFAGHGVDWEPESYDADAADATHPSAESIDRTVNHYFSVMGPGFDLTVDDKDSNTVAERMSSGTIEYTGGLEFVTYMHVTENRVRVRFD